MQQFWMQSYLPRWALRGERGLYGGIRVYRNYTGTWRSWWKNGKVKYVGEYINGVKVGTHMEWSHFGSWNESKFDSGTLLFEENWNMKIYNGSSRTYYNKLGKFQKKDIFKNNKLIETETETIVDGCKIKLVHSANNGLIISKEYFNKRGGHKKREYFDKNGYLKQKDYFDSNSNFQKREHFKNNKLFKTVLPTTSP